MAQQHLEPTNRTTATRTDRTAPTPTDRTDRTTPTDRTDRTDRRDRTTPTDRTDRKDRTTATARTGHSARPDRPPAPAGPPVNAPGGHSTPIPAETLASYLRAQATEFLRALRLHRESGGAGAGGANGTDGDAGPVDAARALRRAARRLSGTLHTYQPLLDADWAESMRPELAWLSGTLAMEHAYAARLERLLQALHRLSGPAPLPPRRQAAAAVAPLSLPASSQAPSTASAPPTLSPRSARPSSSPVPAPPDGGNLTVGAAKAGALLDRQLTLARTRAHSTALQALGSSRFHAVADKVALLASDVPLRPTAADADLRPLAAAAEERLADAVAALPLVTAGHPYNAEALVHGLSPDTAPHPQDAPWHQVRLLLRLHRYAREVIAEGAAAGPVPAAEARLRAAGQALDRHRDASEAAAAAAQAARTPRIAPATAYALGVLHADQRHEVEAARYAFRHNWQKEAVAAPR